MDHPNRHKKTGHQIKALFLKNLHLQKRQPCTNCCQILTPIICLIFTILIRNAAIDNIPTQNDTLYAIMPLIANKFNDYYLIDQFDDYVRRDKDQWILYQCLSPEAQQFVGRRSEYYHSGMLGRVESTFPFGFVLNNTISRDENLSYGIPPIFKKTRENLTQQLFERYEYLNSDTLYSLRHTTSPQHLPDGAVTFKAANYHQLDATLRVRDVRQFLFYRANGIQQIRMKIDPNQTSFNSYFIIPEGFLSIMDMISRAYIKTVTGATVTSGYTYLPFTSQGSVFIDLLINTVATIIFPLALSLLLPVFLYLIVLEKEQKLIQMMRMNGMSIGNYWAINFLYNLIISLATNAVFYICGYVFLDISLFRQTSLGVVFLILFGWILAQIGLSMFLQVFVSSSRAANIIGYLVAIWTNLVGATLSVAMFKYPVQQPIGFSLWPTFSFTRIFYLLFTYCSMDKCVNHVRAMDQQMKFCITVLYVSAFIFAALGMYLFEVIPQQFGVSRPILFPLHYCLKWFKQNHKQYFEVNQDPLNSDATVEQQKEQIQKIEDDSAFPLICRRLTKQYDSGKLAVDKLWLKVQDCTIFGLLGPNGAGKTTLISMITGIFGASTGDAKVAGYSIKDQISKVHLQMGVCPQFDILWPTLTVQEHLYFYARLRGVPRKHQERKVNETLNEVNLNQQRNYKVTQLSGGMKRRLSIGISLVGDPRIVFMDEPTTGLDPQNRRHLWEVLARCRQKRAIFLTTHLMEQAESLCDRVGIITNGTLRTIGDQFKLKQIYGKGYFVSVSFQIARQAVLQNINTSILNQPQYYSSDSSDRVRSESIITEKEFQMQEALRRQLDTQRRVRDRLLTMFAPAVIVKEIGGLIKMNIGVNRVSVILEGLRELKQSENAQFQWAISDSTLEDVFLQVVIRYEGLKKNSLLDSMEDELQPT